MRVVARQVTVASFLFGFVLLPIATRAADLKEGVEQLAAQMTKAMPEGRQLRVAVTDFPDLGGITSDLGRYIAERLTTRLVQSPKFSVIERRRLGQVLAELKFGMSDLVDPAKAKQLGRMAGVEALVVGSVSDLGNIVDVDARLIEIETSKMVFGATATISKDQVVSQLLTQGREATRTAAGEAGPHISAPGHATQAVPRRSGSKFVNEQFAAWLPGGSPVTGVDQFLVKTKLYNIEIIEGRFLRLNFGIEDPGIAVEVYLGSEADSFLLDQRARKYPLVQATGISVDQPLRVPGQSTRRFMLTFPFSPEMQSFEYFVSLYFKYQDKYQEGDGQLRIEGKDINLKDFR